MRLSRRDLMKLAAGTVVISAAGCGSEPAASPRIRLSPSTPTRGLSYRSARDVHPPHITVLTAAHDTAPGWILLTPAGLMLVANSGEPVWFSTRPGACTNLQVQTYRDRPVLSWWEGNILSPGYGQGEYQLADSSYRIVKTVRAGNGFKGDLHEFNLTDRGTALLTVFDSHPVDLSPIGGPAQATLLDCLFQEVDLESGAVVFQWRASDHVSLDESYAPLPTKATGNLYDFFHINSVALDEEGDYVISGRHTWCVYKISRHDGSVVWRLNGKKSDFSLDQASRFSWQHDVRFVSNSELTLFDDGAGLADTETQSRALKLSLDLTTNSATVLQSYLPEPSVLATSQGSAQQLPNGNMFVGWGSKPYVSEYRSDGSLLFDAALPEKSYSYRAFRFPWVGLPAAAPDLAAERVGDVVTTYASWNGATEIAGWQVLAGRSESNLAVVGSFVRSGFETVMSVRTTRPFVAVRALDRRDHVLGRSKAIKV